MKKVLVLTYGEDPHADSVCNYLSENKIFSFRVDTEKLRGNYKLKFDSKTLNYTLCNGNRTIVIDCSWNIWNRRVMNPDVKKGTSRSLTDIIFEESERTWDGLLISHKGRVVNRPQHHYYSNNKIDQIRFASESSTKVRVPDTIITNDPKIVKAFYKKHKGNICFKLQKGAIVESQKGHLTVYTNKVTQDNMKKVELVSSHPCLFQEYIDKEFETRVIATDRGQIGIAIHSQKSEISKVDFRRYDFENVTYEHVELPNNVGLFCSEMLKHYGLHFGVFDFIYSKDRKYNFLELNPNGQWLWLEIKSGYNLTKIVAENLIE